MFHGRPYDSQLYVLLASQAACLCHGRYWARTSDLQLVERLRWTRDPKMFLSLRGRVAVDRAVRYEDAVEQEGYVQLPRVVLYNRDLSHGAKLLYAALRGFAWQDESCWPGQERLAESLGVTVKTVQRWIGELSDAGLVRIERRGLARTNRYVLPQLSDPDATPVSYQDTTPMSHKVETEKVETATKGIEEVWDHYLSAFNPRRKEPDAGQRKIIADALKVASVDELRTCIDACAASDFHQQRGDGQKAGRKHNRISDILKPKRASQYGSGYTQRERIDFWLDRSGSTGGLTEEERERIRSEWVEARNKWAEGNGPDPGPRPDYEGERQ